VPYPCSTQTSSRASVLAMSRCGRGEKDGVGITRINHHIVDHDLPDCLTRFQVLPKSVVFHRLRWVRRKHFFVGRVLLQHAGAAGGKRDALDLGNCPPGLALCNAEQALANTTRDWSDPRSRRTHPNRRSCLLICCQLGRVESSRLGARCRQHGVGILGSTAMIRCS